MRIIIFMQRVSTIFLLMLCLFTAFVTAAAESLSQQVSREGGVTIKVTPLDLAGTSAYWLFEIVFDSHVTEFNHDMLAIARLTDGNKEHSPIGWEGDEAGGHHRKGVLKFKSFQPVPSAVTLNIYQVDGVAERSFTWPVMQP